MIKMRSWVRRSALGVGLAAAAALMAPAAQAADSGYMVVVGGALNQPDASVVMLDLGSVHHTGDVVTANMAMVVVQPEIGRVPGLSYMLGSERLNCHDRTSQTVHVEVYGDAGTKLTEFDGADPPQAIDPRTPWATILDHACQNASLLAPGASPYASVADGVAAVRAGVEAAAAARADLAPHRFSLVAEIPSPGGSPSPVFLDRAQLEHDGTAVARWMLIAHSPPRMEGNTAVAYDMLQIAFDCGARRSRVRVGMSFTDDLALVRSSVELAPWNVVGARGSAEAREFDAACSTAAPAGEVSFDTVAAVLDYVRHHAGTRTEAAPAAASPRAG